MRTGVLSDASAESIFAPHLQDFHDTHLAKPHLKKHKLKMKKGRSDRYIPPIRPRPPYMALHEYAQILSPMNPKPFVGAFGDRLEAAATHNPDYGEVLTKFNVENPLYSISAGLKPETAFFIQSLKNMGYEIQPETYYSNPQGDPSKNKMRRSMTKLYETMHASNEIIVEDLESVYKQTVDLISPPIPRYMSVGMSSNETSSAPTPSQSTRQSPMRSPGRSPVAKRTRSRAPSRAPSPVKE